MEGEQTKEEEDLLDIAKRRLQVLPSALFQKAAEMLHLMGMQYAEAARH